MSNTAINTIISMNDKIKRSNEYVSNLIFTANAKIDKLIRDFQKFIASGKHRPGYWVTVKIEKLINNIKDIINTVNKKIDKISSDLQFWINDQIHNVKRRVVKSVSSKKGLKINNDTADALADELIPIDAPKVEFDVNKIDFNSYYDYILDMLKSNNETAINTTI